MKLPAIKKLVESYELTQLTDAEDALLNEAHPAIEIEGHDEGEQLTHVIAAIEIKREMTEKGSDFRTAMRSYTERVRNSIS